MSVDLDKSAPPEGEPHVLNLSVISHTNAGKTTLVRTLLARDVGEVRDAAHVTEVASGYVMIEAGIERLMLWDTPGFGDTARLLRRLKLSGNPLGWLLTQVWDRFRERPLWSSQQAVRNAREHADIILYLVNASEDPEDAGYVGLEMEILAWVGKPVVLLLNQMGPPRDDAHIEEGRWERHLSATGVVRAALTLDAFARCWVQEGTLLHTIAALVPEDKQALAGRLTAAWQEINLARFRQSMRILAEHLAAAAVDRETVEEEPRGGGVGAVLGNLGGGMLGNLGGGESARSRRAMAKLAERLESGVRGSTEQLVHEHGLSGKAVRAVLERLRDDYAASAPVKEGFAAMLGGIASGAATGLAADLAAGGLTLGGGMLVGGVLGALGAGGLARGYNLVRGEQHETVRWSEEFFTGLFCASLLRYLAVAHFGRGRGDYVESEHPAFWQSAVAETVEAEARFIRSAWDRGKSGDAEALVEPLEALMTRSAARLLTRFYPEARDLFSNLSVDTGVRELKPAGSAAPPPR